MIEVLDAGWLTSIQDLGRPGFERFGVPAGGSADWFSAAVANRLVGNQPGAALLEFAGTAPTLMFRDAATIALSGAPIAGPHSFDGDAGWRAHRIAPNQTVAIGKLAPGLRGYLAVGGGIEVPVVLGSRSLCEAGQFGGGFGRRLHQGDLLPIGDMVDGGPSFRAWPVSHRPSPTGPWEIRVMAGPHSDAFPAGALDRLARVACLVTPAVDRTGLRIQVPGFHLQGEAILTTPVTAGAIQVTPSGELIVLLIDHPTTGGYPVIATVIHADTPLLAQARPGDTIRFRAVNGGQAASALKRLTDWLEGD